MTVLVNAFYVTLSYECKTNNIVYDGSFQRGCEKNLPAMITVTISSIWAKRFKQ